MRRALMVALIVGATSCAGTAGTDDSSTTSTVEVTTTTVAPTTTTSTEPPTTTTTAPTTTTALEMTPELAAVSWVITFDSGRQAIIDILEDDINVESVDGFEATATDPDDVLSLVVVLDVTSGWAAEDNQIDGAWELTRSLATLWSPTDGAWYQELWQPAFRLVNSGTTYECPAELMVSLADARSSRAEWDETC